MKRFTIIMAACALIAAGSDAQARRLAKPVKHTARMASVIDKKEAAKRAVEAAAKWCATTEKVYVWNGDWTLEDHYETQYNDRALPAVRTCTEADGYISRTQYAYDANGMKTFELTEVSEDDGASFRNSSKLERTYDERVTDFITLNKPYTWLMDAWQASGNNYTQTLTRNADGNVTLMERAIFFGGVYDPTTRIAVTYGEDGKATAITESNLDYSYSTGQYFWTEGMSYTDIVWDRTDGQITSNENLLFGANRISSAKMVDDEDVIEVTVTYDAKGGYVANMSGTDGEDTFESVVTYTVLDDNGSYKVVTDTEYSYEGDPYWSESFTEVYEYDAYGLIVKESAEFSDGTYSEIEALMEGAIEYDPTYGYPLTYTLQEYDVDEEEMINYMRVEYSNYVDVAGIDDITADGGSDAPVEYFNLQGIRVDNPAAGQVYIRRQGANVAKVLVK